MYGECDEHFFPTIMRLADRWNEKIPRICEGGKKQTVYVGKCVKSHKTMTTTLNLNSINEIARIWMMTKWEQ